MKFGIEDTIAKAMRKHQFFDSMSPIIDESKMRIIDFERTHIALMMLWYALEDQLNITSQAVHECRTAEENIAFLINCNIPEEFVREFFAHTEDPWGTY